MLNDVSLELRNKIRKDLQFDGKNWDVNGYYGTLTFSDDEMYLYEECKEWYNVIETYFKTSSTAYCLTRVGRFNFVRPFAILNKEVIFQVDSYNSESWKDWFDIEGKDDGPLIGTVGKVINERTHPQYYKNGEYIFKKEK